MMIFRSLLTAALVAAATPALAHGNEPAGHRAGDPLPAGCVRANFHVPSGKIVHAPAPIQCNTTKLIAAAERAPTPPPVMRVELD